MKRPVLFSLLIFTIVNFYAQDIKFEQEKVNGDIVYYNKARGVGGRIFAHLSNNRLAINVGNDFTGGTEIRSDLFIRGAEDSAPIGTYGKKLFFGSSVDNGDGIWIARYNNAADRSELRINIGDDNNDKLVIGRRFWSHTDPTFTYVLTVATTSTNAGRIGINQHDPKFELDVNGTIHTKEVKIDRDGWPDFVFDKSYKLRSLFEVENYINIHKSLPEIPKEAEVKKNGVDIGEMQAKLLQKIEELTLYTIQQQKQLDEQSKLIEAQGKLILELQNKK